MPRQAGNAPTVSPASMAMPSNSSSSAREKPTRPTKAPIAILAPQNFMSVRRTRRPKSFRANLANENLKTMRLRYVLSRLSSGRIECQFVLQLLLSLLLNLTSRLHYTLIARLAPGSSQNTRSIVQSNSVYLIPTGTKFAGQARCRRYHAALAVDQILCQYQPCVTRRDRGVMNRNVVLCPSRPIHDHRTVENSPNGPKQS
jgi:hypothetical protein